MLELLRCRRVCRTVLWSVYGWDVPVGEARQCPHGAWWRLVRLRGGVWEPNPPMTWVRVPVSLNPWADTI